MKSIYLTALSVCAAFAACTTHEQETPAPLQPTAGSDQSNKDDAPLQTLFASVDSMFVIGDQTFAVSVDQHDVTQQMFALGDTMQRPTYTCVMEILSVDGQSLFRDSLTRESWGYPGKIEAIDAYQMAMPELIFKDQEIVASYRIFEYNSMDAILGSVAFNINTNETRYFWEESFLE